MLPTLNYAGDFVHTDKTCKRGKDCHVGDVVVLLKPSDPSQRVCKRITGLAGDYIQVDPSAVEHEAASEIGVDTRRFIKVPEGHCWVTGDNLSQSLDSRSYGVIPLALIKGRIFGVHSTSEQPVLPSQRLPPQQQQPQQDSYLFPSGQDVIPKSQLITRTPSPATSVPTLQSQSVTPGVVGSPFAPPQDHTKSLSSGSFDFTDSQQFQLKQQQQNQPNMYGSVSPSLTQQQEILLQQQQSQQLQQQQPQQQIHTRNSSTVSHQPQQNRNRISSRFNSISSRSSSLVPSNTNDFNSHSNVSGSFYVHELRRRAATSWCDIPASVWGVPIGIAENALLHTNNGANGKINRASLVTQRRTMDIRHSHLTPRLLASEATQDDSDVISILGDRSTPGPKHVDNDTASIKSTITSTNHFSQQQQQQQGQQSLSPLPSTLQRKNSVDSVKSLEQGFQRIKLFVANPDSDSD